MASRIRGGDVSFRTQVTRAISIRQPYAELILRGQKKNEFRSRPTNIRERIYVYAALRPADDRQAWGKAGASPGDFPTGVIVGSVEIVGCRRDARTAGFAYTLRRPKRLRKPLSPKGQPMPIFWRPRF
jgi:ASCH domain-containing protein